MLTDNTTKALKELEEMATFTPPICHYEEGLTEPPFCKPYEQFQEDARIALDLINCQKAEIERLESEIDKQYEVAEANVRAEIADGGTSCHWCRDKVRAEAIKEFLERLKAKFDQYGVDYTAYAIVDDVAKEMGVVTND